MRDLQCMQTKYAFVQHVTNSACRVTAYSNYSCWKEGGLCKKPMLVYYHDDTNFYKWLNKKLSPSLQSNSVTVLTQTPAIIKLNAASVNFIPIKEVMIIGEINNWEYHRFILQLKHISYHFNNHFSNISNTKWRRSLLSTSIVS